MFSISGNGASPASLPPGWTAYTDPSTSQTYYVHLPTGDTQWTRPPPPPPPPPRYSPRQQHPPPQQQYQQQMTQSYHSPSNYDYAGTPLTPPNMQCHQSQYQSSHGHGTLSNGSWSASSQNFNQTFNQNNLPPRPPDLSLTYNPSWQPKRPRYPSHNDTNPGFQPYNPPAKRPCIQHHSSPSSVNSSSKPASANYNDNNNNGSSSERRKCSKCGSIKTWESFSKRQWLFTDYHLRKCKSCVENFINETTETEKERTKACSSCGEHRSWESFSKTQWTSSEKNRRCKKCTEDTIICALDLEHLKNKAVEANNDDVKEANKADTSAVAADTSPPEPPVSTNGSKQSKQPGSIKQGNNITTTTALENRSKVCSSCGEHRAWELFSKRQWKSSGNVRKCKSCMEKVLASEHANATSKAAATTNANAEESNSNENKNDTHSVDANSSHLEEQSVGISALQAEQPGIKQESTKESEISLDANKTQLDEQSVVTNILQSKQPGIEQESGKVRDVSLNAINPQLVQSAVSNALQSEQPGIEQESGQENDVSLDANISQLEQSAVTNALQSEQPGIKQEYGQESDVSLNANISQLEQSAVTNALQSEQPGIKQ